MIFRKQDHGLEGFQKWRMSLAVGPQEASQILGKVGGGKNNKFAPTFLFVEKTKKSSSQRMRQMTQIFLIHRPHLTQGLGLS
jgi:hypothetical protein